MTSLATLAETPVVKAFLCGEPKTAKTGSLASLANTGRFNIRILDYEGNFQPLMQFVRPEHWGKIEISPRLEDKIRKGTLRIETNGPPRAFEQGLALLDHWKYKAPDGTEVDFGPVTSWGPNEILVIDSITAMGKAAMRWALFVNGRVQKGPRIQDWGTAQQAQVSMIEKLASGSVRCNVLVICHLKLIGPPEPQESDSDVVKEAKQEARSHIPYRLYPSALGRALPPEILGYLPYSLLYEAVCVNGKVSRKIMTAPQEKFSVSCPLPEVEKMGTLPVDSGLATIFDAAKVKGIQS